MNFNLPGNMASIWLLLMICFWIAAIVVRVLFARAVYLDAHGLNRVGTGTIFVSPTIWWLAVLLGGVVVAGLYWAIHHSAFRRNEPVPGNPEPTTWQPPEGSGYGRRM